MKISRNILSSARNILILLAVVLISASAILGVSNKLNTSEVIRSKIFSKKSSWVGQYLSGYHATQIHDYDTASDFFAKSLRLGSSNELTQTQTMNLLVITGRFKEAFEIADHLYQNNHNVLAAIVKIINNVEIGNFKNADIIANQLSKTEEGKTVINQVIFAWIKFGNGNYLAAKNIFEALQSEKRYLPFINYHYALLANLAGDGNTANKLFLDLSKVENPPISIASGTYNYFSKTKNTKAIERVILNYGIDKKTSLIKYHKITNAKEGVAEALYDTASIIMNEYKDDSAATFFRLSLYLMPDFDEAKLMLGSILMNEKDYQSAGRVLKSISAESSVYDYAKLAVAKNYEAMNQSAKAKQYYEKLLHDEDTKLDALINLADLKREAKKYDEAIKYYSEALEFISIKSENPEKIDNFYWSVYFSRGVCYERLGNWKEAEKDFKIALELNHNQPDVLNYLGYTWLDNNTNIEDGLRMVTKAYELKPSDPHILDSVGWGWYKLGDYENALKFLEAAITEMPYDPTVNNHLGDVYWQLNRKTEAKYKWHRALENNPEEKDVANLKLKLKNGLAENIPSNKLHPPKNTTAEINQSEEMPNTTIRN